MGKFGMCLTGKHSILKEYSRKLIVGYLTSKQILGETFSLYFAFESIDEVKYQTVSPYIFRANIINKKAMSDSIGNEILINDGNVDRLNIKVTFDSLH